MRGPALKNLSSFVGCLVAIPAMAEPAMPQFELKTLECAPGPIEFQSQNAYSWGQPARRIGSDGSGAFEADENAVVRQRHALELEFGFTNRLKMRVGVEFEKERLDEPAALEQVNDFDDLKLTEVGAELVAVLIPREGDGAGLGMVAELERPLDEDESSALTLGPIFEWQSGPWFAAAVPAVVYAFGGGNPEGEPIDEKWDLAYATQLMYTFSPVWSVAIKGYGTVERIGDTGQPSESARFFGDFDQHRLGPIVYFNWGLGGSTAPGARGADVEPGTTVSIGLGLLAGLNENTPDRTLKLSIEVDF